VRSNAPTSIGAAARASSNRAAVSSPRKAGTLVRDDVLIYAPQAKAANGNDVGCFEVDLGKLPQAVAKLGHTVFGVKARNDVNGLAALKREFVDTTGPWKARMELIGERWRREPQATFVYAVRPD
jgi:hypothetical protein